MKASPILFKTLMLIAASASVQAQSSKGGKPTIQVRIEQVKEKCSNIPLEKRIRITVARFTCTAANAPSVLGENMGTMLSSALSQVNCFNVLESKKNLSDITGEVDLSNSEYVDASTGIEKGKMKIAQIVVTGEVTEYSEASDNVMIMGMNSKTAHAKIGFILKIINPSTREILKTTSFNVESKKSSGGGFAFFTTNSHTNPAVADALEKGIINAVEYLAAEKDSIPLPSEEELNTNLSIVTVTNVSFSQQSSTLDLLKNVEGVKKVEISKFADNTVVYTVRHENGSNVLATEIDKKYAVQFEITSVSSGKITIRQK